MAWTPPPVNDHHRLARMQAGNLLHLFMRGLCSMCEQPLLMSEWAIPTPDDPHNPLSSAHRGCYEASRSVQ